MKLYCWLIISLLLFTQAQSLTVEEAQTSIQEAHIVVKDYMSNIGVYIQWILVDYICLTYGWLGVAGGVGSSYFYNC